MRGKNRNGLSWLLVCLTALALATKFSWLLPATSLFASESDVASNTNAGSDSKVAPLHARIDELILRHHIGPLSPPATPASLLRRIYLDLWGRPPTVAEQHDYLAHTPAEPLETLVDRLLKAPEFAESFSVRLDVLMFMERRPDVTVPSNEWREYLRRSIAAGQPLNDLYREILAADGVAGDTRPAAKFYLDRKVEWNAVTRDVGRMVFGHDIQCAQCHDHPLINDYRQSEFHGILAFLHRSEAFVDKQNGDKMLLAEKSHGQTEFISVFKKDAQKSVAEPILPALMAVDNDPLWMEGEGYLVAPTTSDRAVPLFSLREQLAVMATHPKSLAFNRNLANRLWALLFGAGLVQPLDLHHAENPPVHAELLQVLADGLVQCQYDTRTLLKEIILSQTYQRSLEHPDVETWVSTSLNEQLDKQFVQRELAECEKQLQQQGREIELAEQKLSASQIAVEKARRDTLPIGDKWTAAATACKAAEEILKKADAQLPTLKTELTQQQQLAAALQPLVAEAAKAAEKLATDTEIVALSETLKKRLTTATDRVKTLETETQTLQQQRDAAHRDAGSARSTMVSIRSRRAALSEFVSEARGVQRSIQLDWQHISDQQVDWQHKKQLLEQLQSLLASRETLTNARQQLTSHQTAIAAAANAGAVSAESQETSDSLQASLETSQLAYAKVQQELLKTWSRRLAIRPLRPLSPEQLSASTLTALELLPAMRKAAEAEWTRAHPDAAEAAKITAEAKASEIQSFFIRRRQEVESAFISMFAATAGAPQDVFESSVDQALFLANDPRVQAWLAPEDGTLTKRLIELTDSDQLGRQLYLSVLARTPDAEELAAVRDFVASRPDDRKSAVMEMVWGLLTSLEFRFMP